MKQCKICLDADSCSFDWCDPDCEYMNCTEFKKPSPTNADCIRAKSDEELASFIERTMYKIYESIAKALHIDGFEEHWDKDVIVKEELEWLKQEKDSNG